MIHNMKLHDNPFNLIKNGSKTIEMRLYDEKRQKVNIGDTIIFSNSNNLLEAEVVNIYRFKSFYELYNNFDKKVIGYENNEIPNPDDMSKYYSNDEINKYGVVGIEIKLKREI